MPRLLLISREDQNVFDLIDLLNDFKSVNIEVIQHVSYLSDYQLRSFDCIIINAYRTTMDDVLDAVPKDIPIVVFSSQFKQDLYPKLSCHKCLGYICSEPMAFSIMTIVMGYLNQLNSNDDSIRYLKKNGTWLRIDLNDITYIKTEGNNSIINFEHDTQVIRIPISKLLEQLNSEYIIRVHRQYAINLLKLQEAALPQNEVTTINTPIPVGRSYKKELKKALKEISINN